MSVPPSLIHTTLDTYAPHVLLGSGRLAAFCPGFRVSARRLLMIGPMSASLAATAAHLARFGQEAWHTADLRSGAQRR